jgi:regulator of protease activity HflC (stomatin/prohibitin superfamily)
MASSPPGLSLLAPRQTMADYGYQIVQSLVVDIRPEKHVKESMNEINASRRLREATEHKADAEKITQVKAAVSEDPPTP